MCHAGPRGGSKEPREVHQDLVVDHFLILRVQTLNTVSALLKSGWTLGSGQKLNSIFLFSLSSVTWEVVCLFIYLFI